MSANRSSGWGEEDKPLGKPSSPSGGLGEARPDGRWRGHQGSPARG